MQGIKLLLGFFVFCIFGWLLTFICLGPYPMMLRAYICTQKLLLKVLEGTI